MKPVITNKELLEGKHKKEHGDYEYYQYPVTKRSEFNQAYVSFYEILPKKYNYPFHYHLNNTEVFFIIKGTATLEMNDNTKKIIKEGDVIAIPAGCEGGHRIYNHSDEMFFYLDVDTTNSPDIIKYPNSNKMGVVIHNESSNFYKDNTVDYYEGE